MTNESLHLLTEVRTRIEEARASLTMARTAATRAMNNELVLWLRMDEVSLATTSKHVDLLVKLATPICPPVEGGSGVAPGSATSGSTVSSPTATANNEATGK